MALLCLFSTVALQAQDTAAPKKTKKEKKVKLLTEPQEPLRAKNGQLILPEKGEIGLSMNVIPFFLWFGNSFNASTNNTYASRGRFFNTLGTTVVMGRYMISDNTAARLSFGMSILDVNQTRYVRFDGSNDPEEQVADTRTGGDGNYVLSLGLEKRRGKGRLRGYYGAELLLRFRTRGAYEYTYGNKYTATNISPTSTSWGSNIINSQRRILSEQTSVTLGVGVRPFVGIEFFVAPKISIGGEFGLAMVLNGRFKSDRTIEHYTGGSISSRREEEIAGESDFSVNLDSNSGAIFMNFYF